MTEGEEKIRQEAIIFAKHNKEKIAKRLTDPKVYLPDEAPISIFMAGSPGAGKTEYSKNLIADLESGHKLKVVHIDGDKFRSLIPGYTGDNSFLFQGAISLITEKVHDHVLHNGQSFVLDSTFTNYPKAVDNIKRSLNKDRPVFILYIYQKPEVAWKFTVAREEAEGRNIPRSAFIHQFLCARETVEKVRSEFNDREVTTLLVKKDFEKGTVEDIVEIKQNNTPLDFYIPEKYTEKELEKTLL